MKKSKQVFRDYLRVLDAQTSFSSTSRLLNHSPRLIFIWLADSKNTAARGDDASVFLFKIDEDDPDETPRWLHEHVRSCISNSIEAIESAARNRARDGVFSPAKYMGRTVFQVDPDLIGRDDLVEMLGLPDNLLRVNGRPVPEMIWQPPATDLVLGVLAAHSRRYRKQNDVNLTARISGGVRVVGESRPPQIAAVPLPVLEIITPELPPAEFAEISSEADEIAEMLGETPEPAPEPAVSAPLRGTGEPEPERPEVVNRAVPPGWADEIRKLENRIGPVIKSASPPEYAPAVDPLIRPTDSARRPLSESEAALLSRLPGKA